MKNRIKRLILPLLCILILVGSFYVYYKKRTFDNVQKQERVRLSEEYNSILKDIRDEKDKIAEEIEIAKEENNIVGRGSTIIMITDTNHEVVDEVEVLLKKYKYKGVIAIDDEYSPELNIEGYLNKDEIDNFVEKGYELVLTVNFLSNVTEMYNSYLEKGYEIKGFYYPNNDMTNSQLKEIKSLGVEHIITYLSEFQDDDVISVYSIGSNDVNVSKTYESNVDKSIITALTIGNTRKSDEYSYDNVVSMLNLIKRYVKNEMTMVTNLTESKERYEAYQQEIYNYIDAERFVTIENLEKKLKDLELRLNINIKKTNKNYRNITNIIDTILH